MIVLLCLEVDELEPKEPKRPRLDTETNIFDQMTSVFDEIAPQQTVAKIEPVTETITAEDDITIVHIPHDTSQEMKVGARVHFVSKIYLTLDMLPGYEGI